MLHKLKLVMSFVELELCKHQTRTWPSLYELSALWT